MEMNCYIEKAELYDEVSNTFFLMDAEVSVCPLDPMTRVPTELYVKLRELFGAEDEE